MHVNINKTTSEITILQVDAKPFKKIGLPVSRQYFLLLEVFYATISSLSIPGSVVLYVIDARTPIISIFRIISKYRNNIPCRAKNVKGAAQNISIFFEIS
jgi:hypothetical protein